MSSAQSLSSCGRRVMTGIGDGCDTAKSFFTNPKNRLSFNLANASFLDKVLKAVDPVLDMAGVIAEAKGDPKESLDAIQQGRKWTKSTRDCTAFYNICRGVIPGVKSKCEAIYELVSVVKKGEEKNEVVALPGGRLVQQKHLSEADRRKDLHVELPVREGDARWGKYNAFAVGSKEIYASLASQFFSCIAACAFIAAFGICRPIRNVREHIFKPIGQDVSPIARKIGGEFTTVMTVNHGAAAIGHVSDLVYQELAYERILTQGHTDKSKREEYEKARAQNIVGFVEKSLEIVNDILYHIGLSAPPAVRLPINLIIAGCSLWKEWKEVQ